MVDSSTLGGMKVGGGAITAYCIATHDCACIHSARLDLDRLIEKLGADFTIPPNHAWFISRLRCSKCGRRHAEIRINPPTAPAHGAGHLSGAYKADI